MFHAVISANGTLEADGRLRALWREADLRIAADGGARNARLHLELAPHVLIGDLDSLDPETAAWLPEAVECLRFPTSKDQTDLELAVDLAAARGAEEVAILGALGGRIDQMLGNILLLARAPRVRLADHAADLWLVRGETAIAGRTGDTVSLIPLSPAAEGIETEGLLYPLRGETLRLGSTRGISNELVDPEARVRLARGLLLVVHLLRT